LQASFGIVMAGDVVLDAFVFQNVPESAFMRAAAITSAATSFGYFLASELGQIILMLGGSLLSLFYISLAAILVATGFTLALPDAPSVSSLQGWQDSNVRIEPLLFALQYELLLKHFIFIDLYVYHVYLYLCLIVAAGTDPDVGDACNTS
jgi:hypothetical protein